MTDIDHEIDATTRTVGTTKLPVGDAKTVLLRRTYDADIDDVWDAITNPDRISRWFLPVTGDLRVGGTYQTQGNAGGEILVCEPPRLLRVSWVMGEPKEDDVSEVEVRLSSGADGTTVFELEHTATPDPEFWSRFGPGAVGVGWDLAVLGLGMYLQGKAPDPAERAAWDAAQSPEAREFMTRCSEAWRVAHEASGATAAEARAAADNTRGFYVPDPAAAGEAPEGAGSAH